MSLWLFKLCRRWTAKSGSFVGSLPRPSRSSAGADNGGIDKPQVAPEAAALLQVFQQVCEDCGPCTVPTPTSETAIDGLPGAIIFRDVAPGGTCVKSPEDAIEDA